VPSGYLYAYLSTWVGQALVSKDNMGSAIKHLEPHHVAAVPVPLLPEKQQRDVHEMVVTAYKLRDEANALLDEGDEMLHHELGLPQFDESLVPYLPTPTTEIANGLEVPHPRAFSIKASDLAERFDASYHVPVARSAIAILQKSRYAPVRLGRMVDNIFIPPRFKRIYVSAQYGIPFLRPSQIPQMRPYDLGYLSRKTEELEELLLHKGDVLVTTDGTVGRVALVSSRIAGWAGSNNIARITYGTENNRNGYVAAFLSSPYGFHQLTREIYGGVVDHIEVPHIAGTWIPDAPPELQEEIGKLVVEAYEKKDMASAIEEAAISRVEAALTGEQDTSSGLHGTS
jgi:type I restriction enzyme S subunit